MSSSSPARISPARLALAARKLRDDREDLALLASDPIAVIGMACRLPAQSHSPEAYWAALLAARSGRVEIAETRWGDRSRLQAAQRLGGYFEAIDGFDADFFGIPLREANYMDPQHRFLLEVVWEALWDAGIEPVSLAGGDTGVFAAIYNTDYGRMQLGDDTATGTYAGIATAHSVAAGRISYLLDIRGPSVAVDTACSSSLVATHMAVRSLRAGDCRTAIVGASSLKALPDEVQVFSRLGMLAGDGRCKTFDAAADGFAAGEGAGAVILKRLSDALQDGDRIRAIVRGTAINHDGRTTVLTAPSGLAQQAVMRAALKNAGVDAAEVDYIETHGTGTPLGDPIEVEALAAVYGAANAHGDAPACVLGAVKTNLGHLEATAGIAGLIKVVLCMENEAIPGNLHFRTLNPRISLEGSRLVLPAGTTPWPRGTRARVAGLSSFGVSGTNAHVIVEEAPLIPASRTRAPLPAREWKRVRCWLPEPVATSRVAAAERATSSTVANPEKTAPVYEIVWRAEPLPLPAQNRSKPRRVLVVEAERGSGAALAALLSRSCAEMAAVPLSDGIGRARETNWTDVVLVLAAEVHLAEGLGAESEISRGEWLHPERGAVEFLLNFARSVTARESVPRLWVVAPGAFAVLPGDTICLSHAPVMGLLRTLAGEHPGAAPVLIDGDCKGEQEREAVAREILSEGRDPMVARRRTSRYAARLAAAQAGDNGVEPRLGKSERAAESLNAIVGGGTTLIVGGLGPLGSALAERLAGLGARRLVLAGRRGKADPARIASLKAAGAEVEVARLDAAVAESVEEALRNIRASGIPLTAVFHAAGVVEDRLLANQSWEGFAKAAAVKIEGAWNLHRLTQTDPVELMVFFSSAAGILGSAGQGSYAAANAFLDSLAHYRASQGLRTLSIDWGAWAGAGMAARLAPEHAARLERQGIGALEAGEALAAMEKAIAGQRTQAAVLNVAWDRFVDVRAAADKALFAELLSRAGTAAEAARERSMRDVLLEAPAEERKSLMAAHVRECARRALSLAPGVAVRDDVPLQETGLDSLMAIDMKNELAQSLQVTLSAGLLFNYPTVGELTEYLLGLLAATSDSCSGAEAAAGVQVCAGRSAESAAAVDNEAGVLEAMSEEEAERLLIEELERSGNEKIHA